LSEAIDERRVRLPTHEAVAMSKPLRAIVAVLVAGALITAIRSPRPVAGQPAVSKKSTEQRLDDIERKLEALLKGAEKATQQEANAQEEHDRLAERRLRKIEDRLAEAERKLRGVLREMERAKRR
jgi:uncharacterized membrane protein YukC